MVFVVINVMILIFIFVCGLVFGDLHNWRVVLNKASFANQSTMELVNGINISVAVNETKETYSFLDGFAPFGWRGTVSAASSCFWAFSGFEMIACAVEESSNPRRDIPVSMCSALVAATLLYVGAALSLTLMVPWSEIDMDAPLAAAFSHVGLNWGRYILSAGTLCGFTTALLSNIYGFARTALAIAEDGLLPACFARVPQRTGVPTLSVITCGSIAALLAFWLDVTSLVGFSVNLILLSYTAVCVCVVLLRYKQTPEFVIPSNNLKVEVRNLCCCVLGSNNESDSLSLLKNQNSEKFSNLSLSSNVTHDGLKCLLANSELVDDESISDDISIYERSVTVTRCPCEKISCGSNRFCKDRSFVQPALWLMLLFIVGLGLVIVYAATPLEHRIWWAIFLVTVLATFILLFLIVIALHRQSSYEQSSLRVSHLIN